MKCNKDAKTVPAFMRQIHHSVSEQVEDSMIRSQSFKTEKLCKPKCDKEATSSMRSWQFYKTRLTVKWRPNTDTCIVNGGDPGKKILSIGYNYSQLKHYPFWLDFHQLNLSKYGHITLYLNDFNLQNAVWANLTLHEHTFNFLQNTACMCLMATRL